MKERDSSWRGKEIGIRLLKQTAKIVGMELRTKLTPKFQVAWSHPRYSANPDYESLHCTQTKPFSKHHSTPFVCNSAPNVTVRRHRWSEGQDFGVKPTWNSENADSSIVYACVCSSVFPLRVEHLALFRYALSIFILLPWLVCRY